MYPKSPSNSRHQQSGLGLVGAIFVIVVVSLLSVAMSRMLEADKLAQSYEILGLKAFLAAESGAQLGVNRLMPPDSAGSCSDLTFSLEAESLRFCTAVVTCTLTTANGENFYTLSSLGQCVAGDFTASRNVEVRLSP
ncbi:MAG: MSHA biogenesis protein MshP [Candidatus Azotimanducaceae bacterium]|jgi:MSHA biogenesis protein MshP